jgi:hypothetical protein
MPKRVEDALSKVADKYAKQGKLHRKKGQTVQQAKNALVYGVMRKRGWKPSREL